MELHQLHTIRRGEVFRQCLGNEGLPGTGRPLEDHLLLVLQHLQQVIKPFLALVTVDGETFSECLETHGR